MYSPYHHQQHRQPAGGLTRYVSAPGSFITNIVDSVMGSGCNVEFSNGSENHHLTTGGGSHQHHQQQQQLHHYFSNCSSSNESSQADLKPIFQTDSRVYNNGNTTSATTATTTTTTSGAGAGGGLQRSYGMNQVAAAAGTSSLLRHSSSPAVFFNHLMDNNAGFSISSGAGGYTKNGTNTVGHGRLKTQLSFTQDSLSQISEVGESVAGGSSDEGFTVGTWDDAINFSNAANKRAKNHNADIMNMSDLESQSLYNLSQYQSNSGQVQCKTRARRGFATHPRSIAERERRGRISENLRKLQELVPNMDKQTSTADMLDLAVQHIKGLQGDVQKLNNDLEGCTCECKKST